MDIVSSVLELKLKHPLLIWITGLSLGTIEGFIENWIFEDAVYYYYLVGMIIADGILGIYRAYKNNNIETSKLYLVGWSIVAQTALLSTGFVLSSRPSLNWLDDAIFVPLVLTNLLSIVKHLSLLHLLPKQFADILYKKVDIHKND
jgi:hypothetical protein